MLYLQRSNYAGGDYYRGDYYRGDYYQAGGLFGSIVSGLGKIAGVAGSVIPGPIGGVLKAGSKILGGTATATTSTPTMPVLYAAPPAPIGVPSGTPGAVPTPGIGGTIQRFLPGGKSGYESGASVGAGAPAGYHWNKSYSYAKGLPAGSFLVRNRSLNPANPRALRRSIRREHGFLTLARRVLRGSGYAIKRSGIARGRTRARRR
jgi:hypothetical protein